MHSMQIPIRFLTEYDHLTAISEAVREDVLSRGNLDSITIVNGINFSQIRQKSLHNDLQKGLRIIQVGSLNHEVKGQHILFQALGKLIRENSVRSVTLDLIGKGDSEAYLRQLATDEGIEENVRFLGIRNRDYIYEHLCDYDLLVQPSLSEGFGLTVIEGIAAKLPVMVSNIDGPMEIVERGKFGYYFKAGDPADCALILNKIIRESNQESFRSKIRESYDNASKKYNIELTVSKYDEVYTLLAGN